MNKEEKVFMEKLGQALETITLVNKKIIEQRSQEQRIILFQAKCEWCEDITTHVSHIVLSTPNASTPMANTAMVMATTSMVWDVPKEPLKTCLACGHTSYK